MMECAECGGELFHGESVECKDCGDHFCWPCSWRHDTECGLTDEDIDDITNPGRGEAFYTEEELDDGDW